MVWDVLRAYREQIQELPAVRSEERDGNTSPGVDLESLGGLLDLELEGSMAEWDLALEGFNWEEFGVICGMFNA